MTHDEMVAVIEHHKNGGEVEYSYQDKGIWSDCFSPSWNFDTYDYRIKENPTTKTVYEFMFLKENGEWFISDTLKTEEELNAYIAEYGYTAHQKTGRQWELPND